jgi:hypothetical protein
MAKKKKKKKISLSSGSGKVKYITSSSKRGLISVVQESRYLPNIFIYLFLDRNFLQTGL